MRTTHAHPIAAALAGLALLATLSGCAGPTAARSDAAAGGPAAPVPAAAGAAAADEKAASTSEGTAYAAPGASERQLARTAKLTLVIPDPAKAAKELRGVAEGLGGYLLNENVVTEQKDGYYVEPSTVTVAVPGTKLDDALDALSKIGEVRNRNVGSVDVTTDLVDLEARIASLRASIARVQALMDKAGTITEIAQVEKELTSRQSELESMLSKQKALAGRVAMAPVTVTLRPPSVVIDDPNPLWQGLTAGWAGLLQSLRMLLTIAGALLPFVVLGVLIWLPIRVWRRRRRPDAPGLLASVLAPATVDAEDVPAAKPLDAPRDRPTTVDG